jgi:predicted O-linked N-acetylglucosamine transferase (SPINDLY family)
MDITQLESLVTRYQQAQPDVMQETEPALQAARKSLAEHFLNASDDEAKQHYAGDAGKQCRVVRRAELQNLPRNAEAEQLAARILQQWELKKSPGTLIAAMLMLQPRELPLPDHFKDITEWLRTDYAEFLLTSPEVFNRIGEADQFAVYFASAVELFHRSLVGSDPFPGSEEIHNLFVHRANFIQFYFNERNLRRTYRLRAEIMETWALKQNAPLAHLFPLTTRTTKDTKDTKKNSKLKVGILSAHFTPQTEIYLMLSYFDRIPRDLCHVTLYSLRRTDHPLEEYCRSRVDNFVLLPDGGAYPQKVDRIRADNLDVLLVGTNTSAVTNPITIMAMFRMARLHVIVENSPVSTGFTHTDYYLSSMFNEPDETAQDYYTERLYRVPGILNYYAYHMDKDPRTISITRAQLGIPEDAVVYFSGANFFKILPDLSNVWSWIFSQVQNSYLILLPFNPNWTKNYLAVPFVNRLKSQMESAGVDFSRIRILNRVPTRSDVHAIMELCDIYLDSFPYAGACSMIDPLTVGLPAVVCRGKTSRSNFAAAMLKGAGLEEMVAQDAGDYVKKAVALGRSREHREQIRGHIRNALSRYYPFSDTAACGVKIAAAFMEMADRQRYAEIRLLQQNPQHLKQSIRELVLRLSGGNPYFRNLAGTELLRLLLIPYFQSLPDINERPHLIDVGAGYGQFAAPFLNMGWSADLFEPNPGYETQLNGLVQQLPGRVRLFKQLPDNTFAQGTNHAEMIRIGNTGTDPNPLVKAIVEHLSPRVLMVETNSQFSISDSQFSIQRDSLVFTYEKDPQTGRDCLTDIAFGDIVKKPAIEGPGAVVSFRKDDAVFLVTLIRLLESFLPARERIIEN